jgi:cell division protein ZipA
VRHDDVRDAAADEGRLMELSLREWIMVASVVGMAAIIGHAVWLRWRGRRNRLRLEIDPAVAQASEVDDLDLLRGELPNGGARVVDGVRVDAPAGTQRLGAGGRPERAGAGRDAQAALGRTGAGHERAMRASRDGGTPTVDAERPPVLLDPVAGGRRVEPEIGPAAERGLDEDLAETANPADRGTAAREGGSDAGIGARSAEGVRAPAATAAEPVEASRDTRGAERPAGRDERPGSTARGTTAAPAGGRSAPEPGARGRPAPAPEQPAPAAEAPAAADARDEAAPEEELIVMQVLARDRDGFEVGAVTTRAATAGLVFGDFNIFHRYKDGRAQRQFIEYSMANAVEPGVFDLSDGGMRTKGVAFFMQLPVPSEPMEVFEDMVRVATDLAATLDGELRDERHSVITPQTIEHCRERVREFNRRQQIRN